MLVSGLGSRLVLISADLLIFHSSCSKGSMVLCQLIDVYSNTQFSTPSLVVLTHHHVTKEMEAVYSSSVYSIILQ